MKRAFIFGAATFGVGALVGSVGATCLWTWIWCREANVNYNEWMRCAALLGRKNKDLAACFTAVSHLAKVIEEAQAK